MPLERVLTGGEETVHVSRPSSCGSCHGSGAKAGTEPKSCETCGGKGKQIKSQQKGGVSFQQISTCPACGGRGKVIEQPCPHCAGGGQTLRDEALTVKIPPGVEEGMVLRVPSHGMPSWEVGGAAGDLFVKIRTSPDPRFERRGADLWRIETIEVAEAVLGTKISAPTLDGSVTAIVSPGTQPDTILRLRGKGVSHFGNAGRGDLLLRIQVRIPEKLSADEKALYDRLHALDKRHRQADG